MPDASRVAADSVAVVVRSIHAMATGERAEFDALYHPQARDLENPVQPPSSRVPGPDCFWSTAQWLRAAFAGLHYEILHAAAQGDLVAFNSTMNGTHTAPWVVYAESGDVDTVFPPTGKAFSATQSHWFRLEPGTFLSRRVSTAAVDDSLSS